jgi:hypothetical protein
VTAAPPVDERQLVVQGFFRDGLLGVLRARHAKLTEPPPTFDPVALCHLIGMNTDRGLFKTAVHEVGHALAALLWQLKFLQIEIGPDPASPLTAGRLLHVPSTGSIIPLATSIAVDVGGGAAEDLVFGCTEAWGVSTDLRVAIARCGSHWGQPDEAAVRMVRDQFYQVRRKLRPLRAAILGLAEELMAMAVLSSTYIVDTLSHTFGVVVPPGLYDTEAPEEAERVAQVHREIYESALRVVAQEEVRKMFEAHKARGRT